MPHVLIKSDIKHQKRCYICPHHLLGALWPKNVSEMRVHVSKCYIRGEEVITLFGCFDLGSVTLLSPD